MSVNNAPKFLGIMLICVLVTLLLITDNMDQVAGAGILGTALGYLAGNGIAAKRGDEVTPALGQSHHEPTDSTGGA